MNDYLHYQVANALLDETRTAYDLAKHTSAGPALLERWDKAQVAQQEAHDRWLLACTEKREALYLTDDPPATYETQRASLAYLSSH